MSLIRNLFLSSICFAAAGPNTLQAMENVMLSGVPDYTWYAGCFGTATGNLMGYWDRNGFTNFYDGPVNGGLAPLDSNSDHVEIRQMWASTAHMNDYWTSKVNDSSYESTLGDPYALEHRPEHQPDCIGDFIGLSQNKWTDLDGECAGNIDAFSYNFWDKSGGKRVNFAPQRVNGVPMKDIQSGLRAWTQFKGGDAEVFSQLVDFNPETPGGAGFSFADLKAEIAAGYPVLLYLQTPGQMYRSINGMARANPEIHGILAYGYVETDDGQQLVRFKNSWGSSGDFSFGPWNTELWFNFLDIKVRGVIGYHPNPKLKSIQPENGQVRLQWDGAASQIIDLEGGQTLAASWFVVEKSNDLSGAFTPVSDPVAEHEVLVPDSGDKAVFYRVKAVTRPVF
jgi:hypothetical protein